MSNPGFTCITCRVAFNNADLQRFHYKSDWHRYNLKRKVAEMPPVTAEDFKQRVLAQQAQNAEAERDTATFCKICSKHFSSWNAYSNHLQSRKHQEAETKSKKKLVSSVSRENAKNREKGLVEDDAEDDNKMKEGAAAQSPNVTSNVKAQEAEEDEEEWEDVAEEEVEESLPITRCLFCPQTSDSLSDNVHHMTTEHSFFIPNLEYLIDPDAMFGYLGEKVGSGLMCLWCNEKGRAFFTVDAVQRHMRDKGHCKLQYEGEAAYEYSDFFDFRSSYPDQDGDAEDNDDEDEEGSDDESEVVSLDQEGYELVLPSGAKIGHRELMRYYNQNLPPKREIAVRNSQLTKKLKHYYMAIGWSGHSGEVYARQAKDMKVIQRFKDKQRLKVATNANKLQKHFRPQVIF